MRYIEMREGLGEGLGEGGVWKRGYVARTGHRTTISTIQNPPKTLLTTPSSPPHPPHHHHQKPITPLHNRFPRPPQILTCKKIKRVPRPRRQSHVTLHTLLPKSLNRLDALLPRDQIVVCAVGHECRGCIISGRDVIVGVYFCDLVGGGEGEGEGDGG